MKKTFKKITATTLAMLTVLFTFCITSFAAEEKGGADVHIGSSVTHYDSLTDAWKKVTTAEEEAKIVFYEDWTANSDGNFGKGDSFMHGALSAINKYKTLTIDLNGHTIDRGLTKARSHGEVFYFFNCMVVITDTSAEKTGVITGGFSSTHGGAVVVDVTKLTVENITIKNNTTEKRGGAVWAQGESNQGETIRATVIFDNCLVTGNKANKGGAAYIEGMANIEIFDSVITKNYASEDAGIHTEVYGFDKSFVTLGGKVIIADNIAEKDGTGLMLDENFFMKVYIFYDNNRPLDDESRIVILSKTDDKTLRITEDSSEYHFDCYEYENDSYEIIKKGSGNEKYLDIKKA